MTSNENIDRVIYTLFVFLIVLSIVLMMFVGSSQKGSALSSSQAQSKNGTSMEYENKLFSKDKVTDVNIQIDEACWNSLLNNSLKKKYYSCNVVINGETFKNVGIRTKGSSSLEDIKASGTSNRYSLMIDFNKYVKGQTCYGLDKLALNNNYGDATAMKDALTYDMFYYLKGEAPLCNFAKISVNGNYFGCYLALEAVNKSFCQRNFGNDYGNLYKPEGGDGSEYSCGTSLCYTDDKLSSYSGIWDTKVFKSKKDDRRRVIEALKNINAGTDTESYLDIDNVLKYMAVQTIAVNLDGPSGRDIHNYYLYEKGGKLSIIPWDYNLAYGSFSEGDMVDEGNADGLNIAEGLKPYNNAEEASKFVNFPIDTPFTGDLKYRTFFMKLLENDAYRKQYHEYLNELTTGYINGGVLKQSVSQFRALIDTLVATDPNALYTKDQYNSGIETLLLLLQRKAISVRGQLDGTIPSTREGQKADSSALIPCDDIILTDWCFDLPMQ